MSFYFNNTEITDVYFNNVKLDSICYNNTEVYSSQSSEINNWVSFYSNQPFTLKTMNNKGFQNDGQLYSWDGVGDWTEWSGKTQLTAQPGGGGYMIILAGEGNTYLNKDTTTANYFVFTATDSIHASGRIDSLLDWKKVDAGEDIIMGDYCYYKLFYNCTKLETIPELPQKILSRYCYNQMFYKSGVTDGILLPATTVPMYAYGQMFANCTSLVYPPKIMATLLETYAMGSMFYGCTKLEMLPKLRATGITTASYQNMFNGCTKIKLSATQTGDYTKTYRIPDTLDGSAVSGALNNMFANTGGTFKSAPTVNKTYYTVNDSY